MSVKEILTVVKQIVAALLSLVLPLFGIVSLDMGAKAPESSEVTRIMSFNVRNGEYDRGKIVPQAIADYMPDSVGLQECEGTWYLTLEAYLPEYGIVGVGRLTGIKLLGESTAIMYRKDKYDLVDSGTFWLSETPNKVSIGWDAAHHRTCTWVILENKETHECYAHINTHLDHKGVEANKNGLKLVIEKAMSFDMPTVVTGDFNFSKGTDRYNTLVSSGLSDTQDMAIDTMYGKTYHGYDGGESGAPIDFICVNGEITDVRSYKIIRDSVDGQYLSDHYPICADVVLP